MYREGSTLIPGFAVVHLPLLVSPQADAQQKLHHSDALCAAARIPTVNSGICLEALRPQRLLFIYRAGSLFAQLPE